MKHALILFVSLAALSACQYQPNPSATSATSEESLQALLASFVDQNPNDYISIYTLARVADRAGDAREATHWLRRLEATSWDRVIEDGDFPNSGNDPSFRSVRDRLNARAVVMRSSEEAFAVDAPDLLPEGVAYDPTTDRFLVSSGRMRKVLSVGRDGSMRDLVASGQDGIFATLGMKVDDRRREVWVASAAAPFMIDADEDEGGRSALYVFDADTGETKGRWEVGFVPALLNDVVVAPDGTVFATESMTGAILRRLRGADDLDLFLPKETFFSPNGIAISDDGRAIFVAHYHGISRVEVSSREVTLLEPQESTLLLGGIDGLYFHRGDLVGIQNLVGKGRILKIGLDGDHTTGVEILETGNPAFRNPTTGTIADGAFFFLANPNLQVWDGERVLPRPDGELLKMVWIPLATDEAKRLTRGSGDDRYPAWSPDGTSIAFQRVEKSSSRIMVLDVAEGSVRPIATGSEPKFSPDGSLVLVSDDPALVGVWSFDTRNGKRTKLLGADMGARHPDVRDDGAIAFTTEVDGILQIARVDGDGAVTWMTSGAQQSLWPRWSPDGSSILYFSRRDGNDELYVQDAEGSGAERRITHRDGHDFCPAWAPDGLRIAVAFSSELEGRRIDLVDLDGAVLCSLATGFERVSYPTWSPDGSRLAFAARQGGDWDIWLVGIPRRCRAG